MDRTTKRMSKIMDELIRFFFQIGSSGIHMDLHRMGDGYALALKSDFTPENRPKVEEMKEIFETAEKNVGIEEIYWGLAGEDYGGEDSELQLVAQMADLLRLEIVGNQVEMVVCRKKRPDA